MSYDPRNEFYEYAPGVVLTRDIEAAIVAAYDETGEPLTEAQVLALVEPLMPEGNPPEYTAGAPPAMPLPMPGATPLVPAALPPQPDAMLPIDGQSYTGTVATFARGLPRFVDSNPAPDGWAIDGPVRIYG